MKLVNQRCLVTGSNQGLGLAIAKAFVTEGANVMMCARNADKLEQARREVAAMAPAGVKVAARPTDVSRLEDLEPLVAATLQQLGGLDAVVANAGVYGPKGPIDEVDWDEWVQAININLIGVVATCRAVLPKMKEQRRGRIIILSGGGATKGLPFLSAYAASKAGVVRFCETLADEVKEYGITVNAVAPGALNTRMLDEILEAGPEKVGRSFYENAVKQKEKGGAPLEVGASLCAWLAGEESGWLTGKLISAVWDPWKEFTAEQKKDLLETDIYTLRRIIPSERGKTWG